MAMSRFQAKIFLGVTLALSTLAQNQSDQIQQIIASQKVLESRLDALESNHTAQEKTIAGLSTCLDYMWLLLCGALVMFMQAGFAILEAGACRSKNAGTVLMKNVMDACVGAMVWYFVGYGLAYGLEDDNQFMGTSQFAGSGFFETDNDGAVIGSHARDWFFQWAFCATAATIVSGAVAERIQFGAYVLYAIIMTGIIYPVIVYWTWSGQGFLTIKGYSDFAGSGIVHMTGGVGAIVCAAILGPRETRWEVDAAKFEGHNLSLVVLGTFILWFGWYGFNCGSTLAFSDAGAATQAALVAMNTTLSAASGGLTILILRLRTGRFDIGGTCNGILAGLVAVCAGVANFEPSIAIVVGFIGALAQELGHVLVLRLRIDDPLDAFAVHGCGGAAGVLLRPLLDKNGADASMFGIHCLAIVCIAAWSGGISALVFGALRLGGWLRTDAAEQDEGADATVLHCSAYHINESESKHHDEHANQETHEI